MASNPVQVKIRPVRSDDIAVVRDLTLRMLSDAPEAFGETFAMAQAHTDDEWAQFVTHIAESSTFARGFIAYDGIGTCGFVLADTTEPRLPPGTVLVSRLWADRRVRGTGTGRALMDAATEWARHNGKNQVALGVSELNLQVMPFYEHLGYVDIGVRVPWPVDPSKQVIVMARQI